MTLATTIRCDARTIPLPDRSVQCVVTSPPYFGLRDYGTDPLVWGGDATCDHAWDVEQVSGEIRTGMGLKAYSDAHYRGGGVKAGNVPKLAAERAWCQTCGAWQGHLGLEPTPELYIAHLVEVFRDVRRVLRDDGVLWLNLGDTYARDSRVKWDNTLHLDEGWKTNQAIRNAPNLVRDGIGYKPKDLIGIPWMVAFALRADGWYLRQDIIWHKPNPMPESVRDRCTKAHEYLFLLTKAERYCFDGDAIKEPSVEPNRGPRKDRFGGNKHGAHSTKHSDGSIWRGEAQTRNKRDVWTIATKPYKGAHFAVFPEALVEPCVLAGSKPGDLVLDPFSGSGTTVAVAKRHGRHGIGCELNPTYHGLARARIGTVTPAPVVETPAPDPPAMVETTAAPEPVADPDPLADPDPADPDPLAWLEAYV